MNIFHMGTRTGPFADSAGAAGSAAASRTGGVIVGVMALIAGVGLAPASAAPAARTVAGAASDMGSGCHLANGVKHVVNIMFDNVHFYRDNPNVPSDLEMMPNLMHFIENNGVMLSNNHTPLIAHTADDILTTYTGLYGDRQGMPIANDYQVTPTPAGCDGATVSGNTVTPDVACTYPSGTFGELNGNITGLLATEKGDTTPFTLENDTAPEFYVTGNPGAADPRVRQLERDTATLTADNPYAGGTQTIANYLADPTEEAILHIVNADPARTPTFALFAKPDYYLYAGGTSCSGPCVSVNDGFAWDHGDYAAEINTNWAGFAGPGVKPLGLDGNGPADGPNSAGVNSGQTTVAQTHLSGTWTDETDIRPTLMYLTGLKDDYIEDGRVITQILDRTGGPLGARGLASLGACYSQLNSSVGDFAAGTLTADTKAVESATPGDALFTSTDARLLALEKARDALATPIKDELYGAEFAGVPVHGIGAQLDACGALITAAAHV